ncbi:myosin light chain kinase, smooth muscle isoform X1 [Xiphophorus couchianus]|uniref:myosin light chain kinase, smooth muscle isoform X1 n=1 Tax=Xiphophorus couchianus TaxID=32473 RepID=UPI0010168103|nr:myosin light chain kinase, smooth muscle isoform X1 [Xiphophorus couchianus]XP_027880033.1 myosin light chain kinase, smooth muscle isoform X1 [Xiphophorus couchianus]
MMSDVRLSAAPPSLCEVTASPTGCGFHSNEPPAFVLPPRNVRVSLGGDARLEGKVRGQPEPQVTWYRDGKPVIGGGRCSVERGGRGTFSLLVGGVSEEDLGCYTCQATNEAGSRQVTVEILLEENYGKQYILPSWKRSGSRSSIPAMENRTSIWSESPPKFISKPSRVVVRLGQSGKFSTKTTGRPQPQVTWYKGEAELQSSGRISVFELSGRHFLEIKEVQVEDAGSYTCSVTNSAGAATASAELIVQGVPEASSSVHPSEEPPARKPVEDSISPSPGRSTADQQQGQTASRRSKPLVELPHVAGKSTAAAQIQSSRADPVQTIKVAPFASSCSRALRRSASGSGLRFEAVPLDQEATEGAQVTFTCQVSSVADAMVTWLRDGNPVRTGPGHQQRRDGTRLILTMDRVTQLDNGTYGCQLTTPEGLNVASATWRLRVNRASRCPMFVSELQDCSVSEGQSISLQVRVEGKPDPNISWQLNGRPLPPRTRSSHIGGVAKLMVQNASRHDDGVYVCVAENIHGRAESSAQVQVKGMVQSQRSEVAAAGRAPCFIRRLSDLKVMDGSRVSMTVELSGEPPPVVMWLHDGQEVSESEDFHLLREENRYTLLIQEVFPEDTGAYSCRAWNQYGEDQTQARLTVEEPQDGVQPWFITKPKAVSAVTGQHVLLSCAIAGDPFPQYTWTRVDQNRALSSGGDYELLQKEDVVSLLIRRVRKHHEGDFLITLRNKVGECSAVAQLSITEGEPEGGDRRTAAARGRPGGGGGESRRVSLQRQEAGEEEKKKKEEDPRGLLKRSVETRERGEEELRQREAQQLDFRSLLGRRALPPDGDTDTQKMDFKANLRGVKGKAEEKANSPQQVDFRSVLGKKGAAGSNGNKPAETPPKNAGDLRSVLTNKKKTTPAATPEKNGEKVNNCVDGGLHDQKSEGGKGGGGEGTAPDFVEKLKDVTVLDGQRLRLECRLASAAAADVTVTWTLDGKTVKPSKFIVLANEGGLCSLTIDKALPEDEGQYKCRAEHSAGRAECSCMVLVDDPPENSPTDKKSKKAAPTSESEARIKKPTPKTPPKQALPPQILQFPEDMKILAGEKVEILCKYSGAPPITCTWLKFRKPIQEGSSDVSIESTDSSSKLTITSGQQEHCGCYTVELRNSYGLRQAALNLTIVDKPDPPAKVPATSDIRRASLTLSWYGPTYDGGSAVQTYHLEIWDSVDQQWKQLVSCNSTSYNIQNLLPERQYKFRIRAQNIYGIGEPSAESEAVTMGLVDDDNQDDAEAEEEDEDSEKEPEYRDVTIKTDVKVKELYDVEERLGTGKFGQVFKLLEKSTKKVWAGKFIKAYSAKDKENVRQEISIMNSLHHPKLVQCVDAFEGKSDIVMVLEMISGGELFERIIDEDFELTEREVIKYMLQIIDGVNFIHKQGIVHLDLKPENIMCVNKTGSKIKLIDFGLARRLANAGTLKVLFGTPEFVAPEVINYEAISYPTDMWSIGVICYILLSGLSPFMGDNDNETLANVTSATWDFEDEAFDEISENAKDFITNLLKKDMKARLSCPQCFEHPWLKQDTNTMKTTKLSKERMKKYILRRKWQKTGHAVRAIGRLSSMAMMAGVSAKKGSPTEEDNQFLECLEYEQKTESKPTFTSVIKDVEVVEGSAARFDCKIEGYPDPEVVWYKDDQPIKETRHFQIDYDEEGNCSLIISEVSGDDDAKYMVKAVNSLGEATCTADLLVEVMAGEDEEEEEEEE